jgi:hypothetical protein
MWSGQKLFSMRKKVDAVKQRKFAGLRAQAWVAIQASMLDRGRMCSPPSTENDGEYS